MADRFPLIANEGHGQIQELPSGDNLDLSGNNIVGVGTVSATTFVGDASVITGMASTDNIRTNTNATFLQNVNVSGTVTATSYSGDGSNLTSLPAGNLTGTLPAIDGSGLTNISAGGMTLIHKAVVSSASTITTIEFTNLDYDSLYKIIGKKVGVDNGYYAQFRPYLNGSLATSGCNYSYLYYYNGYSYQQNNSNWMINDGGFYNLENQEYEFEFHTGTPTWVRGIGAYFDNYQSNSEMWGHLGANYTPYSSYRISGIRVAAGGNNFHAGTTLLLYKYNES